MKKEALKLIASIVICECAGIIGSVFTAPSVRTWYATVIRPDFAPADWVFAPVWTVLFALMGIAVFLVWKRGLDTKRARTAISIFALQLILNICWSVIFFGFHSLAFAFIELCALWLSIVATMIAFYRISRSAAYLLIPYVAWVSFAGYLNYTIWIIN